MLRLCREPPLRIDQLPTEFFALGRQVHPHLVRVVPFQRPPLGYYETHLWGMDTAPW